MDRASARGLLEAMRAGATPEAKLSGQDFQRLVFWAMVERVLPDLAEGSSIEEHPKGAIDIVVTERTAGPPRLLDEVRSHYFECKHHGRPLELDTIAKTLVVGVREQPLSLNVVSSTHLLPQALDYAYALFAGGDPSRAPMFRHPVFRHFTVGELIADGWRRAGGGGGPAQRQAGLAEISWSLSECLPFMERTLATSEAHLADPVAVAVGALYRLSVLAPALRRNDHLSFSPSNSVCELVETQRNHTEGGSRVDFVLRFTAPASLKSLGVFTVANGKGTRAVITPGLAAEVDGPSLHAERNLREPRTQAVAARLADSSAPRLTLVEGPPGVGKSVFCEELARWLRTNRGFDADRFTIEAPAEGSLLQRMLVSLFTPASARAEPGDLMGADLAEALLMRAAAHDAKPESIGPDLVIPILVRGLAGLGDRLLILRDCHLVSEASAKWIWLLATGLDDIGWGGVRLILESRSPAGQENPHWSALRERLSRHIKRSCVERLEPLRRPEFASALEGWFKWIDGPFIETLFRRTGGVPLLLASHLRALEVRQVLLADDDARWLIRSPGGLSDSGDLEVSGQAILTQQLGQVVWPHQIDALPDDVPPLGALGLLAALGADAERVFAQWLGFDGHAWETFLAPLEQAAIIRRDPRDGWSFAHDLMRLAALEMSAASGHLSSLVIRLDKLCAPDPSAWEAIGNAATAVGRHDLARRRFNGAYEQAVRAEDFTARLRLIRKLHSSWISARQDEDTDTILAILDELGWAEWTAGSLLEARKAYEGVTAEALGSMARGAPLREAAHRAADGRRRALGVSLELADWAGVLQAAREVFELGGSKASVASTLNRLVQSCARLDLPDLGLKYAGIAMPHLGADAGENAAAVLATDLSHVYSAASPHEAASLLRRALELSETPRQRTYGRLNLLTAGFAVSGSIDDTEAQSLNEDIQKHGYMTMRARLDLLRACAAIQVGELAIARILLDQAQMTIALYGQSYLEPALQNAQLVCAYLAEDHDAARQHLAKATMIHRRWARDRRTVLAGLETILDLAERQASRFAPDTAKIFELPVIAPRFCGAGRQLGENLSAIRRSIKAGAQGVGNVRPTGIAPPGPYVAVNGAALALPAH